MCPRSQSFHDRSVRSVIPWASPLAQYRARLQTGEVAPDPSPVGRLASAHTQQDLLDVLQRDHRVNWSVKVLRCVTAAVSAGIAPYLRQAQQQAVLGWLAQAYQSRGRRRVTLAVGRDYTDVAPMDGVILGSGGQNIAVSVNVIPVG